MTFSLARFSGRVLYASAFLAALLALTAHGQAGTLGSVKERGKLLCGVSEGLPGFSAPDANGKWSGFDVDFCRAVSAAVFGDSEKVSYVSLNAVERFDALKSGKIDVLSRNTTWTMERDIGMEFEFAGVSYFDGQGFMVSVDKGLSSAMQLEGATVCLLGGTTSVDNARSFFERNKITVTIKEYKQRDEALTAYEKGECGAYSADRSALASQRTKLKKPEDHMLLPEVISKEPLGPVVRQDDPEWAQLVRWVLFLLVNAEEAEWDSAKAKKGDAATQIKVSGDVSAGLGLDEKWTSAVIAAVGNYGEIFRRNIGKDSPLKLERGINALWTQSGILYAPPMR